jgi:hypothetical protein
MNSKLLSNPDRQTRADKRNIYPTLLLGAILLACVPSASAGDAPQWMRAAASAPLPPHDEKDDAVLMYSEVRVTVQSTDKFKIQVREAYKILRPSGREHGVARVYFNPQRKVKSLKAWSIPAQGKDFEVKEKDSYDISAPGDGAELVSDTKARVLQIPAADPGNIVGYEYEVEEQPFDLQESWDFQRSDPVRESRFFVEIPSSWEYKASWVNHAEVKPAEINGNSTQWVLTDIPGIRGEPDMPPWEGLAGKMIVSFFPPGGSSKKNEFANWESMGLWYSNLVGGQMTSSPQIQQQVLALTAGQSSLLPKMRAIAQFVQRDIRYVAIELGIGGFQPHPAADVFAHRYGDCKDKATLMRTMLHEIGVDSYHVAINHERGSVSGDTPAYQAFDHVIAAIRLPDGVTDPSLVAVMEHPKLGKILFFDPTDEITPLGQLRGALQANYGLLVTPGGGELVKLPQQPSKMNSIQRSGKLTLGEDGTLKGEVTEMRLGDRALNERWRIRAAAKDTDRIKPIESLLAASLANFSIVKASVMNLDQTDQPFGFRYSFVSSSYAKSAGDLLLVRPRVLGQKASGVLETKEPRRFPYEFEGPTLDTDNFEFTLPVGYQVDELPIPVDADYSFASYHSKTEAAGNTLRYTRSYEIKELSVPVSKMAELKQFYRTIASDERSTAVLKHAPAK